jgi:hypothetical protein
MAFGIHRHIGLLLLVGVVVALHALLFSAPLVTPYNAATEHNVPASPLVAPAPPTAGFPTEEPLTFEGAPQFCDDGVRRARNQTVRRFLTTAKIHRKYGLTNVLLIAASMFAYASLDNRGVTFPKKSPVNLEELIDLKRTEKCLSMANVLLEPREVVDKLRLKQVSAWRLGLHLGSRQLAGSIEHTNASALLAKHRMNMGLTNHIPIVSYGDFFLRFPFFAIRPLDACFYLSRIVFGAAIEAAAEAQLSSMRGAGYHRFMALHLRLESDVLKLDKRMRRVEPSELARFWKTAIHPLLVKHAIDAVYICAGELETGYMKAVTTETMVPVVWRTKRGTTSQQPTTNHEDAAVDLLVAQSATVAVSTERSTFFLAILSRRCPMVPRETRVLERFRNTTLFRWSGSNRSLLRDARWSASITPLPGLYNYRLESSSRATTLSRIEHVGCSKPWQGHCFYGEP